VVDYRGEDVSGESLVHVLTGRHSSGVAASKRIFPTEHSNVLVYFSGHGGEGFLKFQVTYARICHL
jgi:phosphatidylinositol glycan class K